MACHRFGQTHTPLVARIDEPNLINNHTYVLEPLMAEVTKRLWYTNVLILYSIVDVSLTFLGLLSRLIKK